MKIQTQNFLMYYIKATAYNLLLVLTTGAVIQTFMLECGISEEKVSLYVSAMQIIQTLTMLVLSKKTENVKNILKAVGLCFLGYIPFFVVMIVLCFDFGFTANTKFVLIFAVSILMNLFLGVYSIICYKLPHVIMDMKNYGKVLGQSGVIAGVVSMIFSALMTMILMNGSSYFGTMKGFFVFGIVLSAVALTSAFKLKKISDGTTENSVKVKINFFKYKPFYQLIIPNFMRGFSQGIFNLITVIGYSCGLLDLATAAVVATLTQISMLVSCQSYSFLVKKVQNGMLILISSVVFCVISPLMTATTSRVWFYVFYFIAYFFVNYVSYSVPVLVAKHIDYKVLSQYTAWRMALYTLGIAAGGAVVPPLLELIGHTGTLIVCGVSLLPCGIGYYLFERQKKKDA